MKVANRVTSQSDRKHVTPSKSRGDTSSLVANRVTSQSDRKRKTIKESVSLWGVANRVTSQSDRKK